MAINKSGNYTKPRKWTPSEVATLLKMKAEKVSREDMAKVLGRTETSIAVKLKRLSKESGTYNRRHVSEKYKTNQEFLDQLKPSSVLDLYAGEDSFYKGKVKELTSNDKAYDSNTYKMDALKCICLLYSNGEKFDLVDLDPFGSAYDCLDLALKIAKKGLIVTYGETGHVRFKRCDFLGERYGINKIEDYSIDKMIDETKRIGRLNKKKLTPIFIRDWYQILRVYYTIEPIKKNIWVKNE